METSSFKITENWLTRKPSRFAYGVTVALTLFLFAASFLFFRDLFGSATWMPASREMVFQNHQWWRAWTALFAHADGSHLISNAVLFIPLTYLLVGYFGLIFFPIIGLASGGLINLIVLQAMPAQTELIGVSGVVYWMGAAWLTLYLLIDGRENWRKRFASAIFLSIILFIPETYKPQVSYLSHLIGFILGAVSGLILYAIRRRAFRAAEVKEYIFDEEFEWPTLEQKCE